MKIFLIILFSLTLFAADDLNARKAGVRALLDRRDFAAALRQASAIGKERPDDIECYEMTAAAQIALGEYDAAEKSIQWMLDLRLGKADAPGWLVVARFREATGDLEGAIDSVNLAYGRLAAGDATGPRLIAYAAHLHLQAGHLKLAEQALQGAAAAEPAATETLARLRIRQGRRDEAVAMLRTLVDKDPRALYLLAETTLDPADYAAFEKSARERMGRPDHMNVELALFLAGAGKRPEEALRIARGESAARRDVFTLDALAMALFANGEAESARAEMKKVIEVGTRDPRILAHISQLGLEAAQ